MFLKEFQSTDLQRDTANVFKAAYLNPVIINRQKKEPVIMLSKKAYAKLVASASKESK